VNAPWWRLAEREQTTDETTTQDADLLPPFYD